LKEKSFFTLSAFGETPRLEGREACGSLIGGHSLLPALSLPVVSLSNQPKGAPRLQHFLTPRTIQHIGMVFAIQRKGP
jgi:hypothetical protein